MSRAASGNRTFQRRDNPSIFGADLDAHLLDMRIKIGCDDLPYVLGAASEHLRAHALATPGIFRQNVEATELSNLKQRVEAAYSDRRRLDFANLNTNAHAVGALLKQYLKELPRPLLSSELYPYFLAARDNNASNEQALTVLRDLLSRLPPAFHRSTRCVLQLLREVAYNNSVMNVRELSKLFAPLMLRSRQFVATSGPDASRAEATMEMLIANSADGGALISLDAHGTGQDMPRLTGAGPLASMSTVTTGVERMSVAQSTTEVQWYYIDQEQNYVGPVNTVGLRQLLTHQYVNASTYVWASHLTGWLRLGNVPELANSPAPPTAVPQQTIIPAAPASAAPAAPAALTVPTAPAPSAPTAPTRQEPAASGAAGAAVPALPSLGLRKRQQSASTGMEARPNLVLTRSGQGGAAGASGADADSDAANAAQLANLGRATPPVSSATTLAVPTEANKIATRERAISAAKPNMLDAPEALEVWDDRNGLRFVDEKRRVRAIVAGDGEVKDSTNATLAYIEANGEVGSHEMEFLGAVKENSGQVIDRQDQCIGEFDQGRGYVKNPQGSVIAEISKEGVVSGNGGMTAGYIQGFSFESMYKVAAYILLVDPDFVAKF
mmetsp:Transcript_46735/g.77361  ORF Transcript_46735/g.77361 Transcript_46735/m.77361 type:complete len:610 (+) Transcript_46735:86-1915(+)